MVNVAIVTIETLPGACVCAAVWAILAKSVGKCNMLLLCFRIVHSLLIALRYGKFGLI